MAQRAAGELGGGESFGRTRRQALEFPLLGCDAGTSNWTQVWDGRSPLRLRPGCLGSERPETHSLSSTENQRLPRLRSKDPAPHPGLQGRAVGPPPSAHAQR